jgi:septum formation protein
MSLILASASPRRRELLRAAGIAFEVEVAEIPEVPLAGEAPRAFAERMALQKATAGWAQRAAMKSEMAAPEGAAPKKHSVISEASVSTHAATTPRSTGWVLGADTIVVVDGEILGKPRDAEDAARMLRMLSGRTHEVITAVALFNMTGNVRVYSVQSETTRVTFSELSEEDIAFYVATSEPMDKAGAYGIQGIASRWIPRIEGDYSNVVGLPVALVWKMLRERGVPEHGG